MAVILLQAAGAAVGSVFGPVGAALGQAAGALAGGLLDNSLINSTRTIRGKGLSSARIPAADEGSPIARVHGTARITGTLIWATRFEEQVSIERLGGKAGGPKTETFSYGANFALGLCEGPIAGIRRVWADGRELDLSGFEMRVHKGTEDQLPDPLIEAKQGNGLVPAWRGLAYVVFERLPLDGFGNRIPVLSFEVIRPIGYLENSIEAITVIPGATEHGYALTPVSELKAVGEQRFLNRNTRGGATDWSVSIDELQAVCPNLKSVALVTAWMGTDLRVGEAEFHPGVEVNNRPGESRTWQVGNLTRSTARLISQVDGAPIYGGTPDDAAVIEAIADLKARGLEVLLYPFVLMDIVAGNGLADPYGGSEQPALPWRGRITCSPATGQQGSPDGDAQIRSDVAAFCGVAQPSDVIVSSGSVSWTGGLDAGYRRMILHHAGLALAAGGVDGFLIGSELRGLTRLRDETGAFPFVDALCDLASDVKAMLGSGPIVSYAADWSEYASYRPDDGSGDVFFNLDPLWAHPAIGAIGIDNYMPLSDWRDDDLTEGNVDNARHGADSTAMEVAITSGEGFDWFYASESDRKARLRTPITDGLANKPWVYRTKDIRGWWQNLHYDRAGGTEAAEPSDWVPASKPIWFTELGCPAVDKGACQPNVFPDPRSSEGALPYFSTGARSDETQRAFLQAHAEHWTGTANADGMVDVSKIFVWTWDARPFPAFPTSSNLWADGASWRGGHWLNGRLGSADLADLFAKVLTEAGFTRFDVSGISGSLNGYVIGGIASVRQVLEPLMEAFAIDVVESADGLAFSSRLNVGRKVHSVDILVDEFETSRFEEVRSHESELPSEAVFRFFNPLTDHAAASSRSRRLDGGNPHQTELAINAALDPAEAGMAVERWLKDQWAARRQLSLIVPPGRVELEPGDLLRFNFSDAPPGLYRLARIEDGFARRLELVGHAASRPDEPAVPVLTAKNDDAHPGFAPKVVLADLPIIRGEDESAWAVCAAHVKPWRSIVISASAEIEDYQLVTTLDVPARLGELVTDLPPGAIEGRFDHHADILLDLAYGGLESATRLAVLDGANVIAVEAGAGNWEIIQFENADEVAPGRWRLTSLLRGQAGTDDAMGSGSLAGALVLILDKALKSLSIETTVAGLERNYIAEPSGLAIDKATTPQAFAGGLRARTPLSPVHLEAKRQSDAVAFSWVRRARMSADSWVPSDIPLGEEVEIYRVEILSANQVVRQVEVSASQWNYASADELADFGSLQTEMTLRVSQGGSFVPWGVPRTQTLSII